MTMSDITIVDETDNYLVVEKPHSLATVPLSYHDDKTTLLSMLAGDYPEILGDRYEGYVLHRLDTETRGLVLIARNETFYRHMLKEQKEGRFIKHYHALCSYKEPKEGYPSFPFLLSSHKVADITSSFRAYGVGRRQVRPVSTTSSLFARKKSGSSEYVSSVLLLESENGRTLCDISLDKGFRHQVRSHLAWASLPIIGDKIYHGKEHQVLHLISYKVGFYNLIDRSRVEYCLYEDGTDPFCDTRYKE
ncbi:MAG: pseudouridine synthase family protein [Sphaerochaetaceae bacterium]